LIATKDFSITIQSSLDEASDYLRPINWIVSTVDSSPTRFVIFSPYEIDTLLLDIRKSGRVRLHMYAPRTIQEMKSFDDLTFYCIPPLPTPSSPLTAHLKIQLNLWAGQLYLPDYEQYLQLCNFLGLYTKDDVSDDDIIIQGDGFIKPEHRRRAISKSECPFSTSPVPLLKEIMSLRRKGMPYSSTHIGRVLDAKLLTEADF
jgi:hypothetical protein